jgi:hypothetical protein
LRILNGDLRIIGEGEDAGGGVWIKNYIVRCIFHYPDSQVPEFIEGFLIISSRSDLILVGTY